MCVILTCPKNVRPSLDVLEQCARANPHGGGMAWRENGWVRWLKTNDVEEIYALSSEVPGEIVIHFRVASVGGICHELRHPFPVTDRVSLRARGRARAVLFQNGTWHGWVDAAAEMMVKGHPLPAGPLSDARVAAWVVRHRGPELLEQCAPSRWVYFERKRTLRFGCWSKRDGIYFSNDWWEAR